MKTNSGDFVSATLYCVVNNEAPQNEGKQLQNGDEKKKKNRKRKYLNLKNSQVRTKKNKSSQLH